MNSLFQLLDQLDRRWADGEAPNIEALLHEADSVEMEMAVELCAADLEWRWRTNIAKQGVGARFGSLPARPHASDYRSLLAQQWEDVDCRRNLLEAEWCARSVWGDAPDVDEFASQLSMFPDWNSQLAEQLTSLVPLEVTLTSTLLKRPLKVRVGHDFIIGRRFADEPKAPAWIEQSQRLIVANSHYRVVSREQLRVRRTRVCEVDLTNVSSVIFGHRGNHQLAPGESTRLDLPSSIQLGELSLCFGFDEQMTVSTSGINP